MSIELDPITSGYSTGKINENFQDVENELNNNVLRRKGLAEGEANQMEVNLDMNSRFIYNLPEPILEHQAARLKDVQNALSEASANLITFTPYQNISSSNVQGAIQELIDDLADPAQGGGLVQVTTSTGLQTLAGALDGRANRDYLPINLRDHGVVGDGATDNAAAIQTLLDTIPTGEFRRIVVPAGEYVVGSNVTQNGGQPVWYFDDGAFFSGDGSVPQEFNGIRWGDFGSLQMGGTLYIGKNSGSPVNSQANGGIVFGGYTDRAVDSDQAGILFRGENSTSHNLTINNTRRGGQTQINQQVQPVWGTCDVSGTTVTSVSGTGFAGLEAAKTITIARANYEIASIDSDTQITLTASAPTLTGAKYRIATVYAKVVANITGTTVTRVGGERFPSSISVAFIDGVRYSATFVSREEITLDSAPGDAIGKTVFGLASELSPLGYRLQLQPGNNEQSMIWSYREDYGWFLSSIVTGTGEHRTLRINMGGLIEPNVEFNTDGSAQFNHNIRARSVTGSLKFDDPALVLSHQNSHPNGNISSFNNIGRVVNDRAVGGSGGISFDIYDDGSYNKTPLYLASGGHWLPGADNAYTAGNGSQRLSQVYAANGTINTSDGREKQQITDLSDAEKSVAMELKGMIRKFKWNHAVEEKGDDARWHFGAIAQDVRDAFASQGLDGFEYGVLCYDEWESELDHDGNVVKEAGNRYGVRYDQLLALIISAM